MICSIKAFLPMLSYEQNCFALLCLGWSVPSLMLSAVFVRPCRFLSGGVHQRHELSSIDAISWTLISIHRVTRLQAQTILRGGWIDLIRYATVLRIHILSEAANLWCCNILSLTVWSSNWIHWAGRPLRRLPEACSLELSTRTQHHRCQSP